MQRFISFSASRIKLCNGKTKLNINDLRKIFSSEQTVIDKKEMITLDYFTTRTTSCGVLMSPREPSIGWREFNRVSGSPLEVLCNKQKKNFF